MRPGGLPSSKSNIVFKSGFQMDRTVMSTLRAGSSPHLPICITPAGRSFRTRQTGTSMPFICHKRPTKLDTTRRGRVSGSSCSMLDDAVQDRDHTFIVAFTRLRFLGTRTVVQNVVAKGTTSRCTGNVETSVRG